MTMPAWPELVGFLAAGLLLLTFLMRQMVPLRALALSSSVAWLVYGVTCHIYPVVVVHATLIPLNGFRLTQALRRRLAEASPRMRRPAMAAAKPSATVHGR
ncbi:MAG TPA: hypothetical protein VMB84_16215 [Stellaceae bacterium]|nr:hypothetical protein [Stellaceae bacterium]